MIKVLIVVGKLAVGGAECVCRNIGCYADPEQFQIDYLVFGDSVGAYEPELIEKGCRIWHIQSPREGYIRFFKTVKRLIAEKRYDVVHCHTMFNSGLVLRAAKYCDVPVRIAHSHSIRGPEHRSIFRNAYEKMMRRWMIRYATHLVGCGQAAGEWLFGEKAFREKGIVILNGIDLDRFVFSVSSRIQLRHKHQWEDCFVIGHTGHMTPIKNQSFLIHLMPEILKQRPEAKLVLLGNGEDRSMLEQIVLDLGIEDAVTFTGNVRNVNEYLNAMDVFAFPSLYEGMPLSLLEAQANGLPCVLSDRIPKDIYLTDLLIPLSLDDTQETWVRTLLRARRTEPEQSWSSLKAAGVDTVSAMKKILSLYTDYE